MINFIKKKIIKQRTKNPYQDVNDKYKLIFIHIPKNAGISIEQALFGQKIGHKSIKEFEAYDAKKLEEYFKFSVVRNPYDRLVSAFHFLKKGGRNDIDKVWAKNNLANINNFNEFIDKLKDKSFVKAILNQQHFRPQYEYLINAQGKLKIDYILEFENLQKDFESMLEKINIESRGLKHKNKSNRNNWEEYYDENSKELIHKLYQKDFELFYEKRLK
jgi:chondroitin 4-sulfotransferase 11